MKIGDLVKINKNAWLWNDIGVITDITIDYVTVRWTSGHIQEWKKKYIEIIKKPLENK